MQIIVENYEITKTQECVYTIYMLTNSMRYYTAVNIMSITRFRIHCIFTLVFRYTTYQKAFFGDELLLQMGLVLFIFKLSFAFVFL